MSLQLAAGAGATSVAASVPGEVFDTASTCFTHQVHQLGDPKKYWGITTILLGVTFGELRMEYLAYRIFGGFSFQMNKREVPQWSAVLRCR